jgi:hypothetical protein
MIPLVLKYIASDRRSYPYKETPGQYRRRHGNGGGGGNA